MIEANRRHPGSQCFELRQTITLVPRWKYIEIGEREECLLPVARDIAGKDNPCFLQLCRKRAEPVKKSQALHERCFTANEHPQRLPGIIVSPLPLDQLLEQQILPLFRRNATERKQNPSIFRHLVFAPKRARVAR